MCQEAGKCGTLGKGSAGGRSIQGREKISQFRPETRQIVGKRERTGRWKDEERIMFTKETVKILLFRCCSPIYLRHILENKKTRNIYISIISKMTKERFEILNPVNFSHAVNHEDTSQSSVSHV